MSQRITFERLLDRANGRWLTPALIQHECLAMLREELDAAYPNRIGDTPSPLLASFRRSQPMSTKKPSRPKKKPKGW